MSNLSQFKSSGINNRGAYSGTATYMINDTVTYGGKVYCCKANNVVNIAPTDTTKWDVMVDQPTISVATQGTGTNPANFTLSTNGKTVTLNRN